MAICDQPGVISDQAGSWAKSADDDYKRLQEEAMAELQQLRAGIGMPTGDISIQNPEVTSLFTRIRLFVKGELDVKDLGCLLCCIGPTVDNKLEANPGNLWLLLARLDLSRWRRQQAAERTRRPRPFGSIPRRGALPMAAATLAASSCVPRWRSVPVSPKLPPRHRLASMSLQCAS